MTQYNSFTGWNAVANEDKRKKKKESTQAIQTSMVLPYRTVINTEGKRKTFIVILSDLNNSFS